MLKVIVDILAMLIGAEGARLLREYGAEEAPWTARAWSGNQHASKTQPNKKQLVCRQAVF
ncbi:hypothetical protein [Neobacillus drentensis]|uniref:hypothetical protein n=1 Tax=Neobacillus drentensis TaxID=220684 RepID=UPI002FFE8906